MAENDTTNTGISATEGAPECPKCGAATFATARTMRMYDDNTTNQVTRDRRHAVWRCMRCSNEIPRAR